MSREELLALAERCEQATRPDRELDIAVGRFMPLPLKSEYEREIIFARIDDDGCLSAPGNGAGDSLIPAYTASIDAAMSLVPNPDHWTVELTLFAGGLFDNDPDMDAECGLWCAGEAA